jgi:hypothetical protein
MEPDDVAAAERLSLQTLSQLHLDRLTQELTKRVMVVNEDALTHLVQRCVLAPVAAAGCCKTDGGTCCPNKQLRRDPVIDPPFDQ